MKEEYSSFASKFNVENIDSQKSINIVFINEQFQLDSNDKILLLLNNVPVYFDRYLPPINIRIPNYKEGEQIHPTLYIIRKSTITRHENKSVFYWNRDFNFLFVTFFPDNEELEQILYFPQKFRVIQ